MSRDYFIVNDKIGQILEFQHYLMECSITYLVMGSDESRKDLLTFTPDMIRERDKSSENS